MDKAFISFKESLLPINQIQLSDDELLLIRGGQENYRSSGDGCGCGCQCDSGRGCGCNCNGGSCCGCGGGDI